MAPPRPSLPVARPPQLNCLVALLDPPRQAAIDAIAECSAAGIATKVRRGAMHEVRCSFCMPLEGNPHNPQPAPRPRRRCSQATTSTQLAPCAAGWGWMRPRCVGLSRAAAACARGALWSGSGRRGWHGAALPDALRWASRFLCLMRCAGRAAPCAQPLFRAASRRPALRRSSPSAGPNGRDSRGPQRCAARGARRALRRVCTGDARAQAPRRARAAAGASRAGAAPWRSAAGCSVRDDAQPRGAQCARHPLWRAGGAQCAWCPWPRHPSLVERVARRLRRQDAMPSTCVRVARGARSTLSSGVPCPA